MNVRLCQDVYGNLTLWDFDMTGWVCFRGRILVGLVLKCRASSRLAGVGFLFQFGHVNVKQFTLMCMCPVGSYAKGRVLVGRCILMVLGGFWSVFLWWRLGQRLGKWLHVDLVKLIWWVLRNVDISGQVHFSRGVSC